MRVNLNFQSGAMGDSKKKNPVGGVWISIFLG